VTTPDHFQAFGQAAAALSDPTVIAGRYGFQRTDEQAIIDDVVEKLGLGPDDRLLEVGCGTGNLLRPLAKVVGEAVGVDHADCLSTLARLGQPDNVRLIPGRWPAVVVDGTFTSVLAYSVLHYLRDAEDAFAFIDASLGMLSPGGRALFGDLPNADARRRFDSTEYGRQFAEQWRARAAAESTEQDRRRDEILGTAGSLTPYLGDDFLATAFTRYRGQGYEAYVVPQPPELPFSFTREDLLIIARP